MSAQNFHRAESVGGSERAGRKSHLGHLHQGVRARNEHDDAISAEVNRSDFSCFSLVSLEFRDDAFENDDYYAAFISVCAVRHE